MSKKYFINNADTPFGQILLNQLFKDPEEEPLHMCTLLNKYSNKPIGVKKVLKRQKPKLFRKKALEECEVYIYNVNQTAIEDIHFGIDMINRPSQDNKVFILVSDIMAWSKSDKKIKKEPPKPEQPEEDGQGDPKEENQPENAPSQNESEEQQEGSSEEKGSQKINTSKVMEEQKPVEYTYYQDQDYKDRNALPDYEFIKIIEDRVLDIKKENVKVYVICPGIIYGCGQDTFYQLFKAAWLQQPHKLPYIGSGDNLIPTIHLKDLVRFVIKVSETQPEGCPYLLALDETKDRRQKCFVEAISKGVGSGEIESLQQAKQITCPDRYLIDLDMRPSKVLIGSEEEPSDFEWVSQRGFENIKELLKDFCQKEQHRPIKMIILQADNSWRPQSQLQFILNSFSEYYHIPVLKIQSILQEARYKADQDLMEDMNDEWESIMQYIKSEKAVSQLSESMKVFYRAIRWRLSQNDCSNRGYILQNYPKFKEQADMIFTKAKPRKFKRKIPRKKKQIPQQIQSFSQIATEKDISEGMIPSQAEVEQEVKLEQKQQEQAEQEPEEEVDDQEGEGIKMQDYYPETVIEIKEMGKPTDQEVIEFFTSRGLQDLVYDTTNKKKHEIFQSLRSHIERNGRPKNYLIPEEELLEQHREFIKQENKQKLANRQQRVREKDKKEEEAYRKRLQLAESICQRIRSEGEEEIKKMPFRNYLMQFVVPTLNMGLLEVSNIIPEDPVDLLAEFLYQKSYDAD